MARDLPLTSRLKAVSTALGMICHQQLPTPPDRRASELVWNGRVSARYAYVAGKLWESLDAEIAVGGYCPQRKKAKTFDLQHARELLGTREQFVELAQKQFASQGSSLDEPKSVAGKALLANSSLRLIPSPFAVEWILLAPFCPGIDAKAARRFPELSFKTEDQYSRTFVATENEQLELRWFDWGAAVWSQRILLELPNLVALGIQRSKVYHDLLRGKHTVRHLTEQINAAVKARPKIQTHIGYALSLYSLTKSGWQQEFTPHALKIMSCPNILFERPEVEDCELRAIQIVQNQDVQAKELRLLREGVCSPDLHEFTHPGLLQGYASWAGVAAYIAEQVRPRLLESCIRFEQELQALWWRLHSISTSLQTPVQISQNETLLQTLQFAVQNVLRIGPTEATPFRLFKEAVIATSRFKLVFEEFQQLCRNGREYR